VAALLGCGVRVTKESFMAGKHGEGLLPLEEKRASNVYTTQSGYELKLHPVSIMLGQKIGGSLRKRYLAAGEPLDPPVLTIINVAGEELEGELTANDLELPGNPEETERRRASWAAHQDALGRYTSEYNSLYTDAFLYYGTEIEVDPEWAKVEAHFGIDIPEDPFERKLHYLQLEVLRTPDDIRDCMVAILNLTASGAVSEAELDGLRRSFRNTIRGDQGSSGDGSGRPSGTDGEVVDVDAVPGSEDGVRVENTAE